MKAFLNFIGALELIFIVSCSNQDINLSNNDCIEGLIPNDTLYKIIYEECYTHSLWLEVLNNDDLGKDVKIYTPSPVGQPNHPIEYHKTIEIPVPDQLAQNTRKDTLLGKKIYFRYRYAEDTEIEEIRRAECSEEVYSTFDIPVLILTQFSFNECPQSSDSL